MNVFFFALVPAGDHFEVYLIKMANFGHGLYLPNEAAQWVSNYRPMILTHRWYKYAIMVSLLKSQWLHALGEPERVSVKRGDMNSTRVTRVTRVTRSFSQNPTNKP